MMRRGKADAREFQRHAQVPLRQCASLVLHAVDAVLPAGWCRASPQYCLLVRVEDGVRPACPV